MWLAKIIGAFISLAFAVKTGAVSSWYSLITTGTFCLIIPAFSKAILGNVSPKISVWSLEILVIRETSGMIILVESKRPPKPTSITAISTFSSAK